MASERYARNVLLPQVGEDGQRRLGAARVVVVGAGGLGAPVTSYLVAAGVGTVVVVDDDQVEVSNLQRQVLFRTGDIGRGKAAVAVEALRQLNPEVQVESLGVRVDRESAAGLVRGADVVVDGTDNFATRDVLNEACARAQVPLVWASILRFDAQVSVWWAGHGPCYRCVFPVLPGAGQVPSCAEAGVLGALTGTVGSVQASETLKLLLGIGEPLVGRLLIHDALRQSWDRIEVLADPDCSVCGAGTSAPAAPVIAPVPTVAPAQLVEEMSRGPVWVVDVRAPDEQARGRLERSLAVPMERFRDGSAVDELSAATASDAQPSLVLVCRSGARSAEAVTVLQAAGMQARSLAGGLLAWEDEVGPLPAAVHD